MRDRDAEVSGKGEAAKRRARRRRERPASGQWWAALARPFLNLAPRQRFLGMTVVAFLVLLLSIMVVLPGLSGGGPNATRATQTAVAAILLPVSGLTSTPTPEPTPTPPPEMACAYRALHGDALGTVFAGFEISFYQFPGPYFYFEQCSLDQAPAACGAKQPIPNIDLIEPGWWIEIPGTSQESCEENDGLWVVVQE